MKNRLSKLFEPRKISSWYSVIVCVRVLLKGLLLVTKILFGYIDWLLINQNVVLAMIKILSLVYF